MALASYFYHKNTPITDIHKTLSGERAQILLWKTLGGCTQDGYSYKCESEVDGKTTSVGVTLVKCKPPTIKIELTIEAIGLNYEKEFDSSTDIPIPGASLGGLAGLYINVQLKDDSNDNLHIKNSLRGGIHKVKR
ncbi:uncharacterized protein LOC130625109 [Hydractinia symbiolongicarpus]|uniref:uncharacterized protein LOC130625109 n=1 Tax=Hydractinia symbiolongicarpus TaxID=13093 RepID=UPI002550DE90|nr:uncharacterized protein LOC130625109 [Hydractinia symbiolongicarpus]